MKKTNTRFMLIGCLIFMGHLANLDTPLVETSRIVSANQGLASRFPATASCENLFGETSFIKPRLSGKSTPPLSRIERLGFMVNEAGQIYDMKNARYGKPLYVGQAVSLDVPNLYQWASVKEMNEQNGAGEILKADIEASFAAAPQSYGKGFYVSTNPYDSHGYGEGLTVFKTKGPVFLIKYRDFFQNADPSLLQRLAEAGFDGIRATSTWIAMISNRQLKTIGQETMRDPFWADVKNTGVVAGLNQKFSQSNVWKNLSPDNFFVKLKNNELFDVSLLSLRYDRDILERVQLTGGSMARNFKLKILSEAKAVDFLTSSIEQVVNVFEIYDIFEYNESKSSSNSIYSQALKYVDLVTLDETVRRKELAEEVDLKETLQFIADMSERRKNVEIQKISSFSSFMKQLKVLKGHDTSLRTYAVMMMDNLKSANGNQLSTLILDQKAYDRAQASPFLSLVKREARIVNGKKYYRASVDYATLEQLYEVLDRLPFSAGQMNAFRQIKSAALEDPASNLYGTTLKSMLAQLMEAFFTPEGRKILNQLTYESDPQSAAINLYATFMKIHPFEDGNGRAGRLLYEYLTSLPEFGGETQTLDLPYFDLDTFQPARVIKKQKFVAKKIQRELSRAKNPAEFEALVRKLTAAYKKYFKDILATVTREQFENGDPAP